MPEPPPTIERLDACELAVASGCWPFAVHYRDAIAAHWRRRAAENSTIFNGRVFVVRDVSVADGVLRGTQYLTDFASFLFWRETGFRDPGTFDLFASALVLSRDGRVLVGQAVAGSLNDGHFVVPGGLIDPRDVGPDGRIDIVACAARELAEETGLTSADFELVPGLLAAREGPRIGIGVTFQTAFTKAELLAKVEAHLAADAAPELTHPHVVDPAMPDPNIRLTPTTGLLLSGLADTAAGGR